MLHGHTQDVKHLAWRPHTAELLSCSFDNTIRVWREHQVVGQDDDWYSMNIIQSINYPQGGLRNSFEPICHVVLLYLPDRKRTNLAKKFEIEDA